MNKYCSKTRVSTRFCLAAFFPLILVLGCGSAKNADSQLSSAGGYVLMAKTGISNVTGSSITGNVAVSPAAASYITGFALSADASNQFSNSSSVTGKVFAADYAVPTPSNLTTAIGSMETMYTYFAGLAPGVTELNAGNLGGLTIAPGVYSWSTAVSIATDVTLSGNATATWVMQIAGNLTMAAAKNVTLAGGAQAKNITWQVAGQVTIGTTSNFAGTILSKTAITLGTLATLNGRGYAQSRINLDNNSITQP